MGPVHRLPGDSVMQPGLKKYSFKTLVLGSLIDMIMISSKTPLATVAEL